MNEEQKRFTIEKIEKCNNDISVENSNAKTAFMFGIFATFFATYTLLNSDPYIQAIGGLHIPIAFAHVKNLIQSICKKTGLENQLAYLEYQLEMANLEDNKGKGR